MIIWNLVKIAFRNWRANFEIGFLLATWSTWCLFLACSPNKKSPAHQCRASNWTSTKLWNSLRPGPSPVLSRLSHLPSAPVWTSSCSPLSTPNSAAPKNGICASGLPSSSSSAPLPLQCKPSHRQWAWTGRTLWLEWLTTSPCLP